MPTVTVYANCQSGPLGNILARCIPGVTVAPLKAVHLLDRNDLAPAHAALAKAEIVVHQPIGPEFGELAVERLKQAHPHKRYISFPSIFFDGLFPNSMYLRKPGGGTLPGPIGDYHDARIVEAFLAGASEAETLSRIENANGSVDLARADIEQRLQFNEAKEATLDIQVTELVRDNLFERRLFYVFNHPSNFVLTYVARRVAELLDAPFAENIAQGIIEGKDYLSNYAFPVEAVLRGACGFDTTPGYHVDVVEREGAKPKRVTFDVAGAVAAFYARYRQTPDLAEIFDHAQHRRRQMRAS